MKTHQWTILFMLLSVACASCGGTLSATDQESVIELVNNGADCLDEEDCDEDGVFGVCDENDNDSDVVNIRSSCDGDQDGFVDTPCTSYLTGDQNVFTEEEREELGMNCDVCPDVFNPDQSDEDGDGVGDACVIYPNINLNDFSPE